MAEITAVRSVAVRLPRFPVAQAAALRRVRREGDVGPVATAFPAPGGHRFGSYRPVDRDAGHLLVTATGRIDLGIDALGHAGGVEASDRNRRERLTVLGGRIDAVPSTSGDPRGVAAPGTDSPPRV